MHRLLLFRIAGNEKRYSRSELERWPCADESELQALKLNGNKVHRARRSVVKRCRIPDLRILENGRVELGCFLSFSVKPQVGWVILPVDQSSKDPIILVDSASSFAVFKYNNHAISASSRIRRDGVQNPSSSFRSALSARDPES
jgi:hypothetical protein